VKVVFTEEARVDLEQIADHIARDNPVRARGFVQALIASARETGDHPLACPLVPRYERRGIRRRIFGANLIFYRAEDDRVSVIHVLHGARDYEGLLFPED